ncbi:hypothetical protein EOB36_25500 [Mesorhizobium sp. M6A.T.Cr.TU.017.01.1.1]|uniref:hypothetical protein n=1 Tax=Mesorhizobium sp. M6A.T.Cr.TU.017.01.1.1 TaxID=2496774 RepID=UPI000FD3A847|nr:hypothetical protein [Mesorhizobium sp. M6A.T.Cr.TU.017.01.1.1]RUU97860.1 hypothetical protein EOB36_25500 [Mesorhizobium sp. M6A.T.Cr.TU.017.01.1.1]
MEIIIAIGAIWFTFQLVVMILGHFAMWRERAKDPKAFAEKYPGTPNWDNNRDTREYEQRGDSNDRW